MAEKTLIVYYSRSGKSDILAKKLHERLSCDIDKISYADKNHISFPSAVMESIKKAISEIRGDVHNPSDYERIIFVFPIWKGGLSTPIRSYMQKYNSKISSYSLLAVSGKVGFDVAVKDAENVLGKKAQTCVHYIASQIAKGNYDVSAF